MSAENMSYKCKGEDEGLYVKEILQRHLKFSSRLIRKMKVTGGIMLNGNDTGLKVRVKAGDVVSAVFPEEVSYFEPQDIPLDVVYEDSDLLIVNKQAGLIVHPTHNFPDGTLANALSWRMKEQGEPYKLRFVNRLDMYTSGLVIVGKNSHCQDFLMHEMQENRVVKKYIALVHGIVEADGTVDLPIDKDPNHKARRYVTETGYPSVTHYRVLKQYPCENSGRIKGYSLLELKLDTGRTHQIRVHMTHIGHPLVGDELYAQLYGYDVNPEWMPRQALHAAHLEFVHPVSGRIISADAELPEDIKNALIYIERQNDI